MNDVVTGALLGLAMIAAVAAGVMIGAASPPSCTDGTAIPVVLELPDRLPFDDRLPSVHG